MEIDITHFFEASDPSEFSASIAETGHKDIGARTWASAKAEGERAPLLTSPNQVDVLRKHAKGFGAWSEDEIAAWSVGDCNALLIQLISGDLRDADLDPGASDSDWAAYEARAEEGRCAGSLYRANGKVYYWLGD